MTMTAAVRIISKRAGFRRCGIAHPDQAVVHPASTFTREQLAQLRAEPMLIVDPAPGADAAAEAGATGAAAATDGDDAGQDAKADGKPARGGKAKA